MRPVSGGDLARELHAVEPVEEVLEAPLHLELGEQGTGAGVLAGAEGSDRADRRVVRALAVDEPADIERRRIRELVGIVIGAGDERHDLRPGRNGGAVHVDVLLRQPDRPLDRGPVAQDLGDGGADERTIVLETSPLLGFEDQVFEQVGTAAIGGLDAGRQQERGEAPHLVVGEPLTLVLHRAQIREQLVTGAAPTLLDRRVDEVEQLVPRPLAPRMDLRILVHVRDPGGDDVVVPVPEVAGLGHVHQLGDHAERDRFGESHPEVRDAGRRGQRRAVLLAQLRDHLVEIRGQPSGAADALGDDRFLAAMLIAGHLEQRPPEDARRARLIHQRAERFLVLEHARHVWPARHHPRLERLAPQRRLLVAHPSEDWVGLARLRVGDVGVELLGQLRHVHTSRLGVA